MGFSPFIKMSYVLGFSPIYYCRGKDIVTLMDYYFLYKNSIGMALAHSVIIKKIS